VRGNVDFVGKTAATALEPLREQSGIAGRLCAFRAAQPFKFG
jgi:hypothetical protein